MKNVFIIYNLFYDFDNQRYTLGGIQTYIKNLIVVIRKCNLKPIIVQHDTLERESFVDDTQIISSNKNLSSVVLKRSSKNDIVIYASDVLIDPKYKFMNSIAIQHGITFDRPKFKKDNIFYDLKRVYSSRRVRKKLNCVKKVVCVDYNFQNWYRTQTNKLINFEIIPNFSKIPDLIQKPDDCCRILFARRLMEYRGTRIFAKAISQIVLEYDVDVTIAGEGPDKEWMKEYLLPNSNIHFISYKSEDALSINKDFHIAIVPTIGSEGTSLSLLESMACGCATICSDVGGMTNIVLDGYNGIIVPAGNVEKLYLAVKELILNKNIREKISKNAFLTARDSFSYEKWEKKWMELLNSF